VFSEKEGAPGLELPPELKSDVVDGRFRIAVEANAKLHEVFGGAAGSLEPDDTSGSEGGSGSGGGEGSDSEDELERGGGGGGEVEGTGGGGGAFKRPAAAGAAAAGAAAAPAAASAKKARVPEKTRGPTRDGSSRKVTAAESAMALIEVEVAAAQAARAEQKSFQAEVLSALKAGPVAVPLHSWVETLEDSVVEWLFKERLLSARFTTDGCTARALTKEEKATNRISLKIHKRLLEYGVVLDE
jgi:hypothetical protein